MARRILGETRDRWGELNLYQRFEQLIALLLTAIISVVIATAIFNLLWSLSRLLWLGMLDPAQPHVFQTIFGMIMTVLIALEFNHTVLGIVHRGLSVIQVRTVLLIALLSVL
jgi:uncharacterized membrane protein (DUF373 family)